MKRVTFIAYDCAGDICPYGCVYAAPPDSGPDALAAPKRPNWPCASARNTTTFVAIPAWTAAAAIATAPAHAAAATTPDHRGPLEVPQAERGVEARRVVAVVAVGAEAIDVADVDAGVLGGRLHGLEAELELGVLGAAALVVGGLGETDDRRLSSHRLRHGSSFACPPRPMRREAFGRPDCRQGVYAGAAT